MGTKNKPGDFDCYEAADPDEPIFTLRANDPLAHLLVDHWADLREHVKGPSPKIEEARSCAYAMRQWRIHKNLPITAHGKPTIKMGGAAPEPPPISDDVVKLCLKAARGGINVVLSSVVPPDEIWIADGKGGGVIFGKIAKDDDNNGENQ